jgi:spore germination protein KB
VSEENENMVGIKEYSALVMICLGIKATDSTPTLFYKQAMNAGWAIPIVSFVITFISLFCMLKLLKKYKDKNYIQIMYHLLGKHVTLIVGMFFFGSSIMMTAVNFRQYADIMNAIYFTRTPTILLVVILTASSCIIARFGFEAIGRVAWMVFPWILFIVIAFIILVYNLIKIDYLFPLGGTGVVSVIKGGVIYSGIFSEVIFFAVIFPKVKSYRIYKTSSLIGLGYGVVLLSALSAIYLMVLDYPPIVINSTPFHTVARLIYGGRFISNLEAFFFLFWIIASLVRFSMYLLIIAEIFSFTVRHNEARPLIIPISALVMLIALMPENFFKNAIILRVFSLNIMGIITYSTPCMLLFLSKRTTKS